MKPDNFLKQLVLAVCPILAVPTAPLLAQTAAVTIDNFAFKPTPVTVGAGSPVVWTNQQNSVPHTVVSDNGKFPSSSNLNTKDTYTTTIKDPGSYPYHCSIHPFMKG